MKADIAVVLDQNVIMLARTEMILEGRLVQSPKAEIGMITPYSNDLDNRDLTFGRHQCKRQWRLARKLKCACADRNVDVLAEQTRRQFIDFTLRGNGIFEGIYSTGKKGKSHIRFSHSTFY